MRPHRLLPFLLAISLCGPAAAAPAWPETATGLWSYTSTANVSGKPTAGRICLGPKLFAAMTARFTGPIGKGCKGSKTRRGDTMSFNITCRTPFGKGVTLISRSRGEGTPHKLHLTVDTRLPGAAPEMAKLHRMEADYEWLGACPAGTSEGKMVSDDGKTIDLPDMMKDAAPVEAAGAATGDAPTAIRPHPGLWNSTSTFGGRSSSRRMCIGNGLPAVWEMFTGPQFSLCSRTTRSYSDRTVVELICDFKADGPVASSWAKGTITTSERQMTITVDSGTGGGVAQDSATHEQSTYTYAGLCPASLKEGQMEHESGEITDFAIWDESDDPKQ